MRNKIAEGGPVKAGTLLLSEIPFAYVLASKEKGQRCDYCFTKGKVLKCSVCQFVHYCGRACQKDAWNEHKWECNNMKRIAPKVLPDAARMLSKIICRLSKGDGNSHRSFYSHNSFRMWKDLMSHYSDLKVDKKRMQHFATLCTVLFEFFKDVSLPNTVELMGIYGRMCINSFTILDTDMNSIGSGIYLGASLLDHSCKPNAVATFEGTTINIRATQDVPLLDWDQIRISYIDVMKTAFERQAELMESYYFLCQCERCMEITHFHATRRERDRALLVKEMRRIASELGRIDENQMKLMHGAKCPNTKCDNPVQIPWKKDCQLIMKPTTGNVSNDTENGYSEESSVVHCSECGAKVTDEQSEEFRKVMEFTELHLQNMKDASTSFVDVCLHCLERQEGLLHPLNVMRAQTLDHAVDALIQMQLWERACGLAQLLLPCFRNYYGEKHPLTGLLHLKYGKILLFKMRIQDALEQLKSAQAVLKITHGDKHPLYRQELMPLLEQALMESC